MGCVNAKPPENIDEENDRFCLDDIDDNTVLEHDQIFKIQKSLMQRSDDDEQDGSQQNNHIMHHVMDTLGKQYSVIPNQYDANDVELNNNGEDQDNEVELVSEKNMEEALDEVETNPDKIEQHVIDTKLSLLGENDMNILIESGENLNDKTDLNDDNDNDELQIEPVGFTSEGINDKGDTNE